MSSTKQEAPEIAPRAKHLRLDERNTQRVYILGPPLVRCFVRAVLLARVRAQVPVVVVRAGGAT